MKNMTSVKEIIEEAVIKSKKLKEAMIRAKWKEIAEGLFFKSSPLYIREGVLYVMVESSVLLQHMYMNKNKYIKKINEMLKGDYISEIVLKVGKIPIEEYFNGNLDRDSEKADEVEAALSSDEYKELQKSVENIENKQIKDKVLSLKIQSLKREKSLRKIGYKYCSECGILHKNPKDLCTVCENKNHMRREEILLKLFRENPYTSLEGAEKFIEGLSKEEYDKGKEKKLDKIYKRSEFAIKDGSIEAAHTELMEYFKLETGERDIKRIAEKADNLIELIKEKLQRR
ncbi:DUF721 domain-containing protein [uncultured Ilyobacter sp.]|uniref:DUF721 domain-containing protein n=1 Tax=uncultured Ilyobacter sp. TaxID=544433 RepID=UPI0029C6B283|nr:DUF721 domain-containing protein [uncultured Ilyobacter sp.]